jgi:TRAP-type C4-dicarboxylate transport system permease small subunit
MFIVVVMMILMTIDAVGGLFFNFRVKGSYELVQVILSVVVFTSWAYTQTEHGHIHVVMFIRMFPEKVRFVVFTLVSALSTVVMAIASYGVYRMILDKMSSNDRTATLLIPYWPFYLIELIAFIIFTIALLGDTFKAVAAIFNKEAAEEIQSTWA